MYVIALFHNKCIFKERIVVKLSSSCRCGDSNIKSHITNYGDAMLVFDFFFFSLHKIP